MSLLANVEDKRNFRVSEEKAFGLSTGEKLYSLDQLSEAINLIEPDVFRAHVNEGKNDFAAWVDNVFEEHGLAEQLRQHPTPLRMMVSIEKFLRQPMGGMPTADIAAPMPPVDSTPQPMETQPPMVSGVSAQDHHDQHVA